MGKASLVVTGSEAGLRSARKEEAPKKHLFIQLWSLLPVLLYLLIFPYKHPKCTLVPLVLE